MEESEEKFYEIPQTKYRVTDLEDDMLSLEDKNGDFEVISDVDKFMQIKIKRTQEKARQEGFDCVVTRVIQDHIEFDMIIDVSVAKW